MKGFLRGLLGGTRHLLDGGGKITLSNLQYYENLRQALMEVTKDPEYKVHFWDFTKYNSVTAERLKKEGKIYSPETKRHFEDSDDIISGELIISLENSNQRKLREVYVRKFKSLISIPVLLETETPAEKKYSERFRYSLKRSGQYSKDKDIYYLVGTDGLSAEYMQHDTFGYYKLIKEKFDYF